MSDERLPARPIRTPEEELIPYRASEFEARKVLVLAPHPDDEVFGCGGAIARLRSLGADVRVFIVTDGAGEEPDRKERLRIQQMRLEESARALTFLGGAALSPGELPDRGLSRILPALEEAIARELAAYRPDLVFSPSPVEIHPDHRAVARALLAILKRPETDPVLRALPESRIAFYEVSQPFRPNFLLDVTRVQPQKERAMQAFASQIQGRDYPSFVRALTTYRRMTLPPGVDYAEGYFVLPVSVFRVVSPERICQAMGPSIAPSEIGRTKEAGETPAQKLRALLRLVLGRGVPPP